MVRFFDRKVRFKMPSAPAPCCTHHLTASHLPNFKCQVGRHITRQAPCTPQLHTPHMLLFIIAAASLSYILYTSYHSAAPINITCMHNSQQAPPYHPTTTTLHIHPQGFYSVHGESALFIARDFYRTLAVVKYLGGPPPASTPGSKAAAAAATPKPAGNGSSSSSGRAGLASVTLNQSLFESVIRALLLEGGQHSVQLWEGAGANWSLAR